MLLMASIRFSQIAPLLELELCPHRSSYIFAITEVESSLQFHTESEKV